MFKNMRIKFGRECAWDGHWEDRVYLLEEDKKQNPMLRFDNTIELDSGTGCDMLNALPEGMMWNPYHNCFCDKDGDPITISFHKSGGRL